MVDRPQQPSPHHQAIAVLLTPPRLAPYMAAAGGNLRDALALYRWNTELSGAVYEVLHLFEIALRNTMDAQLRAWNSGQRDAQGRRHSADWALDPARLLVRLVREDKLTTARARATSHVRRSRGGAGRPINHGDVVAQLTLDTWRFLLPDRDPGRQLLWSHALSHAFPGLRRDARRLVDDVEGIYRLRNRVAHLEPLLRTADVEARLVGTRRVLKEIEPAMEQWLVAQQRVTNVLARRP